MNSKQQFYETFNNLLSRWQSMPPCPSANGEKKGALNEISNAIKRANKFEDLIKILDNFNSFPNSYLICQLIYFLGRTNAIDLAINTYHFSEIKKLNTLPIRKAIICAAIRNGDHRFAVMIYHKNHQVYNDDFHEKIILSALHIPDYEYAKNIFCSVYKKRVPQITTTMFVNAIEKHDFKFALMIDKEIQPNTIPTYNEVLLNFALIDNNYLYAKIIFERFNYDINSRLCALLLQEAVKAQDFEFINKHQRQLLPNSNSQNFLDIIKLALRNGNHLFLHHFYRSFTGPKQSWIDLFWIVFNQALVTADFLFAKQIYTIMAPQDFNVHCAMIRAAINHNDHDFAEYVHYIINNHGDDYTDIQMLISYARRGKFSQAKCIYDRLGLNVDITIHNAMLMGALSAQYYFYAKDIYLQFFSEADDLNMQMSMLNAALWNHDYNIAKGIFTKFYGNIDYVTKVNMLNMSYRFRDGVLSMSINADLTGNFNYQTHLNQLKSALHYQNYALASSIYELLGFRVDDDMHQAMFAAAEQNGDCHNARTIFSRLQLLPIEHKLRVIFPNQIKESFNSLPENEGGFFLVGSALINMLLIEMGENPISVHSTNFVALDTPFNRKKSSDSGFKPNRFKPNNYTFKNQPSGGTDLYFVTVQEDWLKENALTRDFTICALFANPDGQIYDPTNRGINDLYTKQLSMIDDPEKCLQEDPVRLLRAIKYIVSGFQPDPALQQALLNWQPKGNINRGHLNAVVGKHLNAENRYNYVSTLQSYGLLEKLFNIKSDGTLDDAITTLTSKIVVTKVSPYKDNQYTMFPANTATGLPNINHNALGSSFLM